MSCNPRGPAASLTSVQAPQGATGTQQQVYEKQQSDGQQQYEDGKQGGGQQRGSGWQQGG